MPTGYRARRVGWLHPAAQQLAAEQHGCPPPQFLEVVDVVLVERLHHDGFAEPVGCGALLDRNGVTQAAQIYVRASHRRRSLGSTILIALEALAAIHGNTRLMLVTDSPPIDALALYAASGWQPVPGGAAEGYGFVRDLTRTDHGTPAPQLLIRTRRAARALVVDVDGRILMTENNLNKEIHWGLPGGGIEGEESALEAAHRELAEETGLSGVQLEGPVAQREYFDDFPDVILHQREEIFWGRTSSTEVTNAGLLGNEGYLTGLRWWSPVDLAANPYQVHPGRVLQLLTALLESGTPPQPLPLSSEADSLRLA